VELDLRGTLAQRARGGVVVVDYFATKRCSVAVGDVTASFRSDVPRAAFVELAAVEGVRVFVEERLLDTLAEAGPTLRLSGPPFARHLSVSLDRPELWINFLGRPGILSGKGLVRQRVHRVCADAKVTT
jgi:hypothetical protein